MVLSRIRELAVEHGCAVFGVADLESLVLIRPDLFENFKGTYKRAVVMGLRLQDAVVDEVADRPTPLYFHNYRQTNYELDRLSWVVSDYLQSEGIRSAAVPASQIIKRDPMSGHISHRLLGIHAGLGFIGRSNLLVNPVYGARLRYVSVLTDAVLEPDAPYSGPECGECRACIEVCPAGAIKESKDDFDLPACAARLTKFAGIPYVGHHVCGVCVKACSGSRRAITT